MLVKKLCYARKCIYHPEIDGNMYCECYVKFVELMGEGFALHFAVMITKENNCMFLLVLVVLKVLWIDFLCCLSIHKTLTMFVIVFATATKIFGLSTRVWVYLINVPEGHLSMSSSLFSLLPCLQTPYL